LECAGIGPPFAVRVRRLLKAALRCYGLRCIGFDPAADGGKRSAQGEVKQ